jgi:AcrR family transcriptional regulator
MASINLSLQGTRVPRQRLSPQASRQAALIAAREILIEAGPQAVTLKAVSARIGKTHANLLHHFGSASGLQRALAAHHADTICETIGTMVYAMRGGEITPRQIVDMIFNAFDREGAGALAAWMLLSGNDDALNPVVEAIHRLVDEVAKTSHDERALHDLTMELVLLALGDSLMGRPLGAALGLSRDTGREIATHRLAQSLAEWQKHNLAKSGQ